MAAPVTSCYDIEKAIKDLFCQADPKSGEFVFKSVDVQNVLASVLTHPGLAVAVVSGQYSDPTNDGCIEQTARIVVSLLLKNVSKEEERRKICHPAVAYVVRKLQCNDLGLEMEPLTVGSWREVTTADNLDQKLMVVEIEFTTQFTITPEAAETSYRELLSICSTLVDGDDELMREQAILKEVNNEHSGN